MNAAIVAALGSWANHIRVDTPERWQGLERPLNIAVHLCPVSPTHPTFDLEAGRLRVMASRHQAEFIMLTRDHVGDTLRHYVPSAEQSPGRPDTSDDDHLTFWTQLEKADSAAHLSLAAPHTVFTSHDEHFAFSGRGAKSRLLRRWQPR